MNEKVPLDETRYQSGLRWDAYLGQMSRNRELVAQLYDDASITDDDREQFASLARSLGGRISLAIMTEDWCGDSAANLPILARLAQTVAGIELRVFPGRLHPELKAAYEAQGIESIPVVSFFDAGFREVGRWIERPKAATERLGLWEAKHPELERLRGSERAEDKAARRALFDGLLLEMAEWYRGGLWAETLREVREVLAGAPMTARE